MVNQESKDKYGDKAVKGATEILYGNNEFNGADENFEEARTEENAFDSALVEERVVRARSQSVVNLV